MEIQETLSPEESATMLAQYRRKWLLNLSLAGGCGIVGTVIGVLTAQLQFLAALFILSLAFLLRAAMGWQDWRELGATMDESRHGDIGLSEWQALSDWRMRVPAVDLYLSQQAEHGKALTWVDYEYCEVLVLAHANGGG